MYINWSCSRCNNVVQNPFLTTAQGNDYTLQWCKPKNIIWQKSSKWANRSHAPVAPRVIKCTLQKKGAGEGVS